MPPLLTIGHSNHSIDRFLELLKAHDVTAVADIRSVPYSASQPQFNRESLSPLLDTHGIAYVFLGEELGVNAPDTSCRVGGRVDFTRVVQSEAFLQGVHRLQDGMQRFRIAVMCSEGEPLNCHRSVLLARHFTALGVPVQHILPDGRSEAHEQTLERMLQAHELSEADLFRTPQQAIEDAYRIHGDRLPSNRPENQADS